MDDKPLTRDRLLEMFEEEKNELIKDKIIPSLFGDRNEKGDNRG